LTPWQSLSFADLSLDLRYHACIADSQYDILENMEILRRVKEQVGHVEFEEEANNRDQDLKGDVMASVDDVDL
jgi:hypothetical protein